MSTSEELGNNTYFTLANHQAYPNRLIFPVILRTNWCARGDLNSHPIAGTSS